MTMERFKQIESVKSKITTYENKINRIKDFMKKRANLERCEIVVTSKYTERSYSDYDFCEIKLAKKLLQSLLKYYVAELKKAKKEMEEF